MEQMEGAGFEAGWKTTTRRIPKSSPEGSLAQPGDFLEGWGKKDRERHRSEVLVRISQICLCTSVIGHISAEKIDIA